MRTLCLVAALCLVVSGCNVAGPAAITAGRPNYNEVIHNTNDEQVFENVLRVHFNESTLFLDVTEVDAAMTIQGVVNGGASGIGSPVTTSTPTRTAGGGTVGNVAITLEYAETPTIRYVPLQGQALVAQVLTPISVDNLVYLYASDWSVGSILTFAVDKITPRFQDYWSAVNAIIELDNYRTIAVWSERSAHSKRTPENENTPPSNQPAAASRSDTLVLYFEPDHPDLGPLSSAEGTEKQKLAAAQKISEHLWIRLLRLYYGTQPDNVSRGTLELCDSLVDNWEQFARKKECKDLPKRLELSTVPQVTASGITVPPSLRMRSALGGLKQATEPPGMIGFITDPATLTAIRKRGGTDFYTLLPSEVGPGAISEFTEEDKAATQTIAQWIKNNFKTSTLGTYHVYEETNDFTAHRLETRLARLRRYILVRVSKMPPDDAYVASNIGGQWYSIDNDDAISKQNFALISQILTMQAVPPQQPPLTPTIVVGGAGG